MPFSRRVATAAIGLVGVISAACSSVPSSPSATSSNVPSSPSATSSTGGQADPSPALVVGLVTSERFGWSAELPAPGWRVRPATGDWPTYTQTVAGAAYTDNFERPGEPFPAFDVSTQQLPPDQSQDEFLADLDQFNEDSGCAPTETEEIVVDGTAGRLQTQPCAGGFENVWEVVVFDGDRVYQIYWVGLAEEAAEDEPVFRAIMESFSFAP